MYLNKNPRTTRHPPPASSGPFTQGYLQVMQLTIPPNFEAHAGSGPQFPRGRQQIFTCGTGSCREWRAGYPPASNHPGQQGLSGCSKTAIYPTFCSAPAGRPGLDGHAGHFYVPWVCRCSTTRRRVGSGGVNALTSKTAPTPLTYSKLVIPAFLQTVPSLASSARLSSSSSSIFCAFLPLPGLRSSLRTSSIKFSRLSNSR
ncbi:MAG: hypothetical protein KatS3mg072_1174 [Meiothermus sp.]|nr:MAG: hypothetical protein KatS3mg072_1174 [Meiothermus sp.]